MFRWVSEVMATQFFTSAAENKQNRHTGYYVLCTSTLNVFPQRKKETCERAARFTHLYDLLHTVPGLNVCSPHNVKMRSKALYALLYLREKSPLPELSACLRCHQKLNSAWNACSTFPDFASFSAARNLVVVILLRYARQKDVYHPFQVAPTATTMAAAASAPALARTQAAPLPLAPSLTSSWQ